MHLKRIRQGTWRDRKAFTVVGVYKKIWLIVKVMMMFGKTAE